MIRLITAVPGAGKTTYIVNQAIADIASGIKKVGIVTFSRSAAEELKKRTPLKQVHISTISSLAGTILKQKAEPNRSAFSYTETLIKAAEKLSKRPRKGFIFDCLYVDEAQDIGYSQYEFLKELIKHCNQVVIVGDPEQSIYEFGGSSSSYMRLLAGNDCETMTMNTTYRMAKDIAKFTSSMYRKDIVSESDDAGTVELVDDPAKKVLELLNERKKSSVGLIVRTNKEVTEYRDKFEKEGVVANYTVSGFTPPILLTVSKVLIERSHIEWDLLRQLLTSLSVTGWKSIQNIGYAVSKVGMINKKMLERLTRDIAPRITSEERVALLSVWRALETIELPRSARSLRDIVNHIYPQAVDIMLTNGTDSESAITACVEYLETGSYPVIRVNNGSRLTISTAHVSKGSEYDDVVVDTKRFYRYEDANVFYVAITRARRSLFIHIPPHVPIREVWNIYDAVLCEFGQI